MPIAAWAQREGRSDSALSRVDGTLGDSIKLFFRKEFWILSRFAAVYFFQHLQKSSLICVQSIQVQT